MECGVRSEEEGSALGVSFCGGIEMVRARLRRGIYD